MEISIIQAIFIGIWAAIAISGTLLGNYTATPLIYATGVGVILGDIPTAVMVGAAGQTVWLGFGISQGGIRPPEPIAPGIFATVLAIVSRPIVPEGAEREIISIADAVSWVGLSIAVGVLMQLVTTALFTMMAPLSEMAKKAIQKERYVLFKIYANTSIIVLMILTFFFGLTVGISANWLGKVAEGIPQWLSVGLKVVGGLLPALGFALILKVMIKKEYIAFVALGYFLAIIFEVAATTLGTKFSVIGLAIAAIAIVLIILNIKKLAQIKDVPKVVNVQSTGGEQDGI